MATFCDRRHRIIPDLPPAPAPATSHRHQCHEKQDLLCECPFWPDDGMCSLKDCSVCECDPKELPRTWGSGEAMDLVEQQSCDAVKHESDVDRDIQHDIKVKLEESYRNPWLPEEKADRDVEYTYVNLLRNPERYTGYKGEHANRIWRTIYEQSCFANVSEATQSGDGARDGESANRIFFRIISGIHSSISAHIVKDYLIDEATGTWGPNLAMFQARLGNPDVKSRVENLYFAYLFVLRAVIKAGPALKGVHYDTGYPKEDAHTSSLIDQLVDNQELRNSCPAPFDEALIWKDSPDFISQKLELQGCFRNMMRVMDCVGCEKCKMWGKLQFLGVATSLKILSDGEVDLERNEVIALINLLERLSASVETVRSLSLRLVDGAVVFDSDVPGVSPWGMGAISGLVGGGYGV